MHIVSTGEYFDKSEMYIILDEDTESSFSVNKEALDKLLRQNIIATGYTQLADNRLWYNEIYSRIRNAGAQFTILGKIESKFKLAGHREEIIYISDEKLKEYAQEHNITNCEIANNGEYKFINVYKLSRDIQFEEYIASKYERYAIKSALLGRKMAFEYIIEGRKVKLKRYTGTAKDVIVPKFITTIMNRAFEDTGVEQILMEDGLESIGCSAFKGCRISTVEIPSTVRIVGKEAFYRNKRLLTGENEYREDRVRILNNETVILDNWHRPLHVSL